MNKSKNFYISFVMVSANGSYSIGSVYCTRKEYIPLTLDYINKELEEIKKANGAEQISLLSFGRFEEEENNNEEV